MCGCEAAGPENLKAANKESYPFFNQVHISRLHVPRACLAAAVGCLWALHRNRSCYNETVWTRAATWHEVGVDDCRCTLI